MRIRPLAPTAALALLTGSSLAAADPRFDVIEPPAGTFQSEAFAVSADGCLVVGHNDYAAFRWRDGVTSPLREAPAANPQIAYALTPDGRVVVGYAGHYFFRLDEQGYELLNVPGGAGNPTEARAVSGDGQSVGGCTHAATFGSHCDWPFLWRSGGGATLLRGLSGDVEYGSVEALSADGSLAAGSAGGRALIWRTEDGTPQHLGAGEVRDLTPSGAVAVGHSGSHAFRWTAKAGMVDLGAETHVAHAVSADGNRIVGQGDSGAFIWEPVRGARPLADVLRDEYGLDLGGFSLGRATAISPDGKTIVGIGSAGSGLRGWRARLHEAPCPPEPPPLPVIDLVELHSYHGTDLALDGPSALGFDSQGRLSVTGAYSRNLERIGTHPAALANPVVEHLLDFSADPPPSGFQPDMPSVLAVGADDSVWVGAFPRQQLLRVAPDGGVTVAVDGSAYPPVEAGEGPLPTAPLDAAFGPNGSLYVSAYARLLRVDPDGSVHELIDAAEAQEAGIGVPAPVDAPLWHVDVDSQSRVFLSPGNYLLVLDGELGTVLDSYAPWDLPGAPLLAMEVDSGDALWVSHGNGLWRRSADGVLESIYWEIPDGAGGTLQNVRALASDDAQNLYYAGFSYETGSSVVVRRTPDGDLTQVLTSETLDWRGNEIGSFSVSDLLVSDGVLFASDWSNRVYRVELPPLPTACTNGTDDDGDGTADFPADPGCLSAEDEGERSFDRPCDNGLDDDQDGVSDFPADPGCVSLAAAPETTECDDGIDNDGDGNVDWDGGFIDGYPSPPDPECAGDPRRVIEHPWYCGLGFEVALVALPLSQLGRRRRRARAARQEGSACSAS